MSETKLSVVLDKTQEIILELLLNSMEIYLAQEKVLQNKEKFLRSSERMYGKGSKGNKLRGLYKDRRSEVESVPKQFIRKPFNYIEPKESLFHKETMAKVNKTAKRVEKQPKTEKSGQPREGRAKEKVRWIGKSIQQARQAIQQAAQARGDAKSRPYHYWPGSKALWAKRKYQKSMELLIRSMPFHRLVREVAQDVKPDLCFQANAIRALHKATESYLVGLLEDSNLFAIHAKCVTMIPREMQFAHRIRGKKS